MSETLHSFTVSFKNLNSTDIELIQKRLEDLMDEYREDFETIDSEDGSVLIEGDAPSSKINIGSKRIVGEKTMVMRENFSDIVAEIRRKKR